MPHFHLATIPAVLALALVVVACCAAVWAEFFRKPASDQDLWDWFWPAIFPHVMVLALVIALVGAWWSWSARIAAVASLAAIVYWVRKRDSWWDWDTEPGPSDTGRDQSRVDPRD